MLLTHFFEVPLLLTGAAITFETDITNNIPHTYHVEIAGESVKTTIIQYKNTA